ncbi:RNA polymerase sigma factor [uncultured Roseburia sp.]|uniref:Sigma-70 family RNA polymerase sigma factor n=1 Tax=Brotonthovivens ammoniilytica TaxID=2981725 RepID=A0ABT2TJY3_9FIRM|nr:sigma-70 family RNA polymerase sigma factor [Brotonthovivens ammoniilytica]MCU6762533.1 sigma-70 family RNA polymerase sigma factor [Brotonthovivens ammoniilytica]SCI74939.1 RNA polymerase sigma factor [uncultured Roseburia sp.]
MLIFYAAILETESEKTEMERLYEKYHRLMLYTAVKMLKEQMAAEDAVHSSFLKIIRHLDKIRSMDDYCKKRFVLTITEHTAVDMLRKKKKESFVSFDEMEDWKVPSGGTVDFYELPEENQIILAIKNMPLLYRDIFLLKYSSGYENREIASIFGITEESVRKRISRGKKKLEEILNKEGVL